MKTKPKISIQSIKKLPNVHIPLYNGLSEVSDQAQCIVFKRGGTSYYVWIYKKENAWNYSTVHHDKSLESCSVCAQSTIQYSVCFPFKEMAEEVVEQLINDPSLRLKLLFF